MQTTWIKRSPSADMAQGIIVFAAGWAGSDELVRHMTLPEGYDFVCLYDYRTLPDTAEREKLETVLATYKARYLMAWSFGVWVAELLFGKSTLTWQRAVAIGGTPQPIDDRYGIPTRAFAVTVRSIAGTGIVKFLERMCGTPEILREYYHHRSTRPLAEIYDELLALQRMAEETTPSHSPTASLWTEAVVGERDAIFPPENMKRYWSEAGVPLTPYAEMPHYPLYQTDLLTRLTADEAR